MTGSGQGEEWGVGSGSALRNTENIWKEISCVFGHLFLAPSFPLLMIPLPLLNKLSPSDFTGIVSAPCSGCSIFEPGCFLSPSFSPEPCPDCKRW